MRLNTEEESPSWKEQVRVIKDRGGNELMSEGSVLRKWREYFEELMDVENESERKDGEQLVNQDVQRIS